MKKILSILGISLTGILLVYLTNYLAIGKGLAEVIASDSRNSGIIMSANYKKYIIPSILVINVSKVSGTKSKTDVFRVLLQFSSKLNREFKKVELCSKGKVKFLENPAPVGHRSGD